MSVNLLPWRKTLCQQVKRRLCKEALLMLILVLCCVGWWQINNEKVLNRQKITHKVLKQKLSHLEAAYHEALEQQRRQTLDSKQEAFLKKEVDANQYALIILGQLALVMPSDIYLTAIQKNKETLYLFGKSPSHTELAVFLKRMAAHTHQQPIITETRHSTDQVAGIDFKVGYAILIQAPIDNRV